MNERPLLIEQRGAVTVLTLNRPHVHNAMNPELVCRLADAWKSFAADDNARVAVIAGAGDSFCSGGDLAKTLPLLSGAREPEDDWDRRIVDDRQVAVAATLKTFDPGKPIVAAVTGHCLAGGMELMLGTHLRISSNDASFGLPEARHGLIPFGGSTVRLPRQFPQVHALEMLLTGASIEAAKAFEFGLLNRVAAKTDVLPMALELAERIARNSPVSIREIMRSVTGTNGLPLDQAFALETECMDRVLSSNDAKEGPAAFMEKRQPRFTGT